MTKFQQNSNKEIQQNFNTISNIIILLILVFGGIGYSVGFHFPNEILPGQFADGNYSFNGSVGIGTSSPTEKLTVKGTSSLYDSSDIITSQPIVNEIAFYKSLSVNSNTTIANIVLPDDYSQGFIEVVASGESGGGQSGRIFIKRFYEFGAGIPSFITVGTDYLAGTMNIYFYNIGNNSFAINLSNYGTQTKFISGYIKVYGGGSDTAGNLGTGVSSITLI